MLAAFGLAWAVHARHRYNANAKTIKIIGTMTPKIQMSSCCLTDRKILGAFFEASSR